MTDSTSHKPVLFVGGLFDAPFRTDVDALSTGATQAAADTLQWGYLQGLKDINDHPLSVISAPFIGSYPKRFRRWWIKSRALELGLPGEHRLVGFLNLPLLKHLSRAVALSRATRHWLLEQGPECSVIGYSLTFDIMWALRAAKRANQRVRTAVIIPDLPEYMNTSTKISPVYRVLKHIESRLVRRMLTTTSLMIVLTEHMTDLLPDVPSIVIEGIAQPLVGTDRDGPTGRPATAERMVVYAGTLNRRYGVVSLCDAFQGIKDARASLVLCGDGDAKDYVQQCAERDPRINYLGRLQKEDVLALEASADLLVNPRQNSERFAAFSFPSKILEYLSTGRPVLCYKLDGIPDEYDAILHYVDGDTTAELQSALEAMLDRPADELKRIGAVGREFALRMKGPQPQVKRLVEALHPRQVPVSVPHPGRASRRS